jgi:membrane associated rhomboid family serine protease
MSVENMVADFRKGPGTERWNGKTERCLVGFVAEPGRERILPVAESSTFRPVILEVDERTLTLARSKHGWAFLLLAAACIALVAFEIGQVAILPGLFAAQCGAAYLEARVALRQLRTAPEAYLDNLAAHLRHAYWQEIDGIRGMARSFVMAGAWTLLAIVQFVVSIVGSGERPDIAAAGLVKSLVPAEPWRLLTGPMLHGSIMHLLMNVSAMIALGPVLERSAHRKLLAPVWLAGALAGSLFSWAALPANSVGASGGLMGIFGFLLVMSWRRRNLLPSDFLNGLLRNLLATAAFGALAWTVIDNAAHLGGFLAGGSIGLLVFRQSAGELPLGDSHCLRALGSVSEAVFVGLVLYTGFRLLPPR